MPAGRAAEETRTEEGWTDRSCPQISAFYLDEKEVGRAEPQGSWMPPRLCGASLRGHGPSGAAYDLGIVVDCVGGLAVR